MIFIGLSAGVYTDGQIARMHGNGNAEPDTVLLLKLSWLTAAVVPGEETAIVPADRLAGKEDVAIWGEGAVKEYLLSLGWREEDIPEPLAAVEIGEDVYGECSCYEWNSISGKAARAEAESEALAYCCETGAPMGLIVRRMAALKAAVESLQRGLPGRADDGPSLSDVGYSLTLGWSDEMKERMRREHEEFCREADRAADAPEDDPA